MRTLLTTLLLFLLLSTSSVLATTHPTRRGKRSKKGFGLGLSPQKSIQKRSPSPKPKIKKQICCQGTQTIENINYSDINIEELLDRVEYLTTQNAILEKTCKDLTRRHKYLLLPRKEPKNIGILVSSNKDLLERLRYWKGEVLHDRSIEKKYKEAIPMIVKQREQIKKNKDTIDLLNKNNRLLTNKYNSLVGEASTYLIMYQDAIVEGRLGRLNSTKTSNRFAYTRKNFNEDSNYLMSRQFVMIKKQDLEFLEKKFVKPPTNGHLLVQNLAESVADVLNDTLSRTTTSLTSLLAQKEDTNKLSFENTEEFKSIN